jgi:DNA-binding transcriptional ArsR family regulator
MHCAGRKPAAPVDEGYRTVTCRRAEGLRRTTREDRMSWDAVKAARDGSAAPPTARLVLLVLASYANPDTGLAYPSVTRLAENTGLSRRTVQAGLTALEAAGEIEQIGSRRGGRGRATRYRVVVRAKGASSTPFDPEQTAQGLAQTARHGAGNGAVDAPEVGGSGKESARARGKGRGAPRRVRQPQAGRETVVELRAAAAAYVGPAPCAGCGVVARLSQRLCDECYEDWAENGGLHPAAVGRR